MTPTQLKPIVIYQGDAEFIDHGYERARVLSKYHPKLGMNVDTLTSAVLTKFNGGFETRNTVYVQERV